jgi:alpha-ketoglutarate-dependent taurine dioxygenase
MSSTFSPQSSLTRKDNPFDPDNDAAYAAWRERKLDGYPIDVEELIVEVNDPRQLTNTEFEAIQARCRKTHMAIVAGPAGNDPDKAIPRSLGSRFGLTDLDCNLGADDEGVTTLKVVGNDWRGSYIPYTNRPIHWHTDGYYNRRERQIRALLLYCVSPAARGGENALLDHEIAYIHLRDTDPDYIRALMRPEVMTIPPNVENGIELRPARSGPVFSVLADGTLHMRYTARTRSIEWAPDHVTQKAVAALNIFLGSASPYIYRATLQSGQGLICNNILHDRSGFDDDETRTRQLYRLRYYQRIAGS